MAINIGALFAPTAAVKIHDWGITSLHMDPNAAYHLAFAVACVSLILSIAIYYTFRPGFKHLEGNTKKKDEKSGAASEAEELSPAETKERIIAPPERSYTYLFCRRICTTYSRRCSKHGIRCD